MLPGQTHSHPRCPISPPPHLYLFLCFCLFNVSSHSLLLPSRAPGQRKALTPRLLPGLHCQLFFIFHGGAGIESKRDRARGGGEAEKLQCPPSPCLFSRISTSCPLLSHHADLHSSPSFPFNSPLLLPLLSSYLCLSFLADKADMRRCTHAGHTQRWYHREQSMERLPIESAGDSKE